MSFEMGPSPTGGVVFPKGTSGAFHFLADAQASNLEKYRVSYDQTSAVTITERPEKNRHSDATTSPPKTRTNRGVFRKAARDAREDAAGMLAACSTRDLISLSNHGFGLNDRLAQLWALRAERESDWSDLVNLVQGSLANTEFERLNGHQCKVLKAIVDDYIASSWVESENVRFCLDLLTKSGFNPFGPISTPVQLDASE
jgi:hypothetical protein